MRWLIYGAGNIGCLYAARLARAGEDVAVLARGARAERIREAGIVLEDARTSERTTTSVRVVGQLGGEFDVVLVALPKPAIAAVLPALATDATPSVVFFGNNAAGPDAMIDALGIDRVLLGFPGAAAVPSGDAIRFVITSAREQTTTIGEITGARSERVRAIGASLSRAGFPVAISTDVDAWLKTHAAEILPTAGALYRAGSVEQLARSRETQRLMLRAIREGHAVLRKSGVGITPKIHRLFGWLPERLLMFAMRRRLSDPAAAIKVGHAEQARDEIALLAQEFRALIDAASIPTPSLDALLPPARSKQSVAPAAENS